MASTLRVVVLKPSKYTVQGTVERFRWGFMPNSTIPHIRSMTPSHIDGVAIEVATVDEYVHGDLDYLSLLRPSPGLPTLLALVGVQSHQFHRALDLAAYAKSHGCMTVIGGPHAMTCDTSTLHGSGVSFALAEAELIWLEILQDATTGKLKPSYGHETRWQQELRSPIVIPPTRSDLRRYVVPMLGLYPARGCPYVCNFCSVTKIAGRKIRSQSVATTLASLRSAKAAGIRTIMFTSDNFNKYPEAEALLEGMIQERLEMKFFVQCDTRVSRQERLVELMAKAGCFQMFVGVESFDRDTLLAAHKGQNRPETYRDIVRLCQEFGISSHFSNIIGFPQDTEASIHGHLDVLQEINPTWASFYILCPIPGTEQYDDFMEAGLISEANLDRFDTTCLTWRHPSLASQQLSRLLFECYRKFFSFGHTVAAIRRQHAKFREVSFAEKLGSIAMSLFVRHSAWRQTHPMSGGVGRVSLDCAADYRRLRESTYGFEMAPLPRSLQLPNHEETPALSNVRA